MKAPSWRDNTFVSNWGIHNGCIRGNRMLEFSDLSRPRIDLSMYDGNNSVMPIDRVHIMDEDTFEQFVTEWLYGCKKSQYEVVQRIGGAGDKGRDVIAKNKDGSIDVYQCKHYISALSPSQFYVELGKLCYYTYKKEIPIPRYYYIIASNDIGPSLETLINAPQSVGQMLIENWSNSCQNKISRANPVTLDDGLKNYISSFDFSILKSYPIAKIIDEYLETQYGVLRFGGRAFKKPDLIAPPEVIEYNEMTYISALLDVYSEELNTSIKNVEELKAHSKCYEKFVRHRKDYYSAETIRRFVRDTFTTSDEFNCLEKEIYDGIIDVYEDDYESGTKRLRAVLSQAVRINTEKSLLDRKLNCIGNSERKGVCHMLTDKKGLRWVRSDE